MSIHSVPPTRLCPNLSVAPLRASPLSDASGTSGASGAIPCQGDRCALWTPVSINGKVNGGECCLTLMPAAMSNLGAALIQIAEAKNDVTNGAAH